MPNPISQTLADLEAATLHMKQVALKDDWAMVERIQRRRIALVDALMQLTETAVLSEDDARLLRDVQRLERDILSRAKARQVALGEALDQVRTGTPKRRKNRVQEAYHGGGRKP